MVYQAFSYPQNCLCDPDNVNACSYLYEQSTFLKSSDAGATWTATNAATPGYYIYPLAVSPQDGSRSSAGTDVGVYLSIDTGLTWHRVTPSQSVSTVVFDPLHPSLAYAGLGAEFGGGSPIGIFRVD